MNITEILIIVLVVLLAVVVGIMIYLKYSKKLIYDKQISQILGGKHKGKHREKHRGKHQGTHSGKNAYVMLMFGGDAYLPGILTMNYSLQKTGTKNDIICMVTDDVSDDAVRQMEDDGMIVKKVPYLEYKSKKLLTDKQIHRYSKWIEKSYTKWNALNMTKYDKILFLDADLLVMKNVDHLFKLDAPAGVFSQNSGYKQKLPRIITPFDIKKRLTKGDIVADASVVLLRPDKKYYDGIKKMLRESVPYGNNCYSGFDEQAIAEYLSIYPHGPKLSWINLSDLYSCSWGKKCDVKNAFIINYFGQSKPWENEELRQWDDTKSWYEMHDEYNKKSKN